jgi:hypothetical protein
VRTIMAQDKMDTDKGCEAKDAWYEEETAAVMSKKRPDVEKVPAKDAVEGKLVYNKPGYITNTFGGQYSPFLPLATLGAAMAIGDRSVVSLTAMTVAGMMTAMQINNQRPDCGIKKSYEEVCFDNAKLFLVDALDTIGNLDVRGDDEAKGKPQAHGKPTPEQIEEIRTNIAILRAVSPEGMEALADMCVKDTHLAKALDRMEKSSKQWAALRTKRKIDPRTDAESRVYQPWAGKDKTVQGKTGLSVLAVRRSVIGRPPSSWSGSNFGSAAFVRSSCIFG